MIRVLITEIRVLEEDAALFARGCSLVTARRRDKIHQCAQVKDRCRSLAAGLLLRRGFLDAGFCYDRLRVTEGEHGKPCVPAAEEKGFYYNLAHAGDYAAVAFAPCPVGIDIETTDRLRNPRKMADRILTPYEKEDLEGLLAVEPGIHNRISPAEVRVAVPAFSACDRAGEEHRVRTQMAVPAGVSVSGECACVGQGEEHRVRTQMAVPAGVPVSGECACVGQGEEHRVRTEEAVRAGKPDSVECAYDNTNEEILRDWLVCVWTRKEACVKAMGTGLYSDFRTIGTLGHKAAARIESAEIFEGVWLSVCAPGVEESIGSVAILAGEDLCTIN